MPGEEINREGQYEYPAHTQFARTAQQCLHQPVADAVSLAIRADRDRPDLGQVLPHDVKSPAANDLAVANALGDPELLYILVQGDGGLGQQPPGTDVVVYQPADRSHVPGPRASDHILHRPHTLTCDGHRPTTAARRPSSATGPATPPTCPATADLRSHPPIA